MMMMMMLMMMMMPIFGFVIVFLTDSCHCLPACQTSVTVDDFINESMGRWGRGRTSAAF